MNKTIIAIGIVALFLMTGFSVVSTGTVYQTDSIVDESTGTWEKPKAYFSLHNYENMVVIDNNGKTVDLTAKSSYENIEISFKQVNDGFSCAWAPKWIFTVLVIIAELNCLKRGQYLDPNAFAEEWLNVMKTTPKYVYCFESREDIHTIKLGTVSNVRYHPEYSHYQDDIEFMGTNVVIS